MEYRNTLWGRFVSRPNRFLAHVRVGDDLLDCHVKNTGRLGELLLPGAPVVLCPQKNPARKTRFDVIAVESRGKLFNIDSLAPNAAFAGYVKAGNYFCGLQELRGEYTLSHSRYDFFARAGGKRHLAEIKGVTLVKEGVALFPDAPTLRGLRHIEGLIKAVGEGYEAHIIFIIQARGIKLFSPNAATQPGFAGALARAEEAGVRIAAFCCDVTPSHMVIDEPVEVRLY